MDSEPITIRVDAGEETLRLDRAIAARTDPNLLSRSHIGKLIREGHASVNGSTVVKPGFSVSDGDVIELEIPPSVSAKPQAQDLPIEVLYEDECMAVIVKPAGMVVHPAAGNPDGTLVNALLYHLDHLSGIGGEERPGIIHRLDKDTSGVMLVAKNDQAHLSLSRQLSEHRIEKHYRAMVRGRMKEERGEISLPIARSKTDRKKMAVDPAGKEAVTQWAALRDYGDHELLDVRILTGRTHQIRVHMSTLGHPILGDVIYGGSAAKDAPRLMLHAYSVAFEHPVTGERMRWTAPCPFSDQ